MRKKWLTQASTLVFLLTGESCPRCQHFSLYTPQPSLHSDPLPLGAALPMAVTIPLSSTARVDGFIDDLICVFLDTEQNRERAPQAVPLAMFVTNRLHARVGTEPIQRRNVMSLPKLQAEGTPDERQTVLGWLLDTHRLLMLLPKDKFSAWMTDLCHVLKKNGCSQEDLDTLVGCLNHTATIMPMARHFLGRLRQRIDRNAFRQKFVHFHCVELKDLQLWKRLLTKAAKGISMNLITIHEPTCVCSSDTCPFGLGGYSVNGRTWQIRIPENSPIFGSPKVNNLLEFLAMVVNVWLECEDSQTDLQCILALGNNTSAIAWLFASSKFPSESPAHRAHLLVARQLASLLLMHGWFL